MFRTLGEEISWTVHMAMEAKGEVRKNKVVEGVGKWAEDRALSSQHSEEPGRKAKEDQSEKQDQGLGERMKRERPPCGMLHRESHSRSKQSSPSVPRAPLCASFPALLENAPRKGSERRVSALLRTEPAKRARGGVL